MFINRLLQETHRGVSTFSNKAEYCNAQFCNDKPNTITAMIVFHFYTILNTDNMFNIKVEMNQLC